MSAGGQTKSDAALVAREVAPWITRLARLGYIAKGVVYIVLGLLTVRAAFMAEAHPLETRSAVERIGTQPFGQIALFIIAVGLLGYALWQLTRTVFDPEGYGLSLKGIVKRTGTAISAFAYLGLMYFAAVVAWQGRAIGRGNRRDEEDWTELVMSFPLGRWVIAGVGVVFLIIAVNQFYVSFRKLFMKRIKLNPETEKRGKLVVRVGQVGIMARGVVLSIIGVFFILAAWWQDPGQAGSVSEALLLVENGPFGPFLLGVVAAGLTAFGVYGVFQGVYRRIRPQDAALPEPEQRRERQKQLERQDAHERQ